MSTAPAKPWISPEEYLQQESVAEQRHEYFQGEIFAMAGGSPNHSQIIANLHGRLFNRLDDHKCLPLASDVLVKVRATGLYTYPDVLVVCPPKVHDPGPVPALVNPRIIFEVLSPSTEQHDRGTKFRHYLQIPSLQELLFVAQAEPFIEHYSREPEGPWTFANYAGLDSVLKLPSIACEIPLALIYANVEWPVVDEPEPLR